MLLHYYLFMFDRSIVCLWVRTVLYKTFCLLLRDDNFSLSQKSNPVFWVCIDCSELRWHAMWLFDSSTHYISRFYDKMNSNQIHMYLGKFIRSTEKNLNNVCSWSAGVTMSRHLSVLIYSENNSQKWKCFMFSFSFLHLFLLFCPFSCTCGDTVLCSLEILIS